MFQINFRMVITCNRDGSVKIVTFTYLTNISHLLHCGLHVYLYCCQKTKRLNAVHLYLAYKVSARSKTEHFELLYNNILRRTPCAKQRERDKQTEADY